jgi:methylmalonyl-CoA mutase N-terminal domain/subunit
VSAVLAELEAAAADERKNLMPLLLDATRALATEGEMVQTLQKVFGTYSEAPAF